MLEIDVSCDSLTCDHYLPRHRFGYSFLVHLCFPGHIWIAEGADISDMVEGACTLIFGAPGAPLLVCVSGPWPMSLRRPRCHMGHRGHIALMGCMGYIG